jgi:hypothetical protein
MLEVKSKKMVKHFFPKYFSDDSTGVNNKRFPFWLANKASLGTGSLKAEKDKKNTPSPNLLFFQKISDSACNEL